MRYGHIFAQTAHVVAFVAVHCMYDGTCTEEEQSLEHCVCKEVEHRGHIAETTVVRIVRSTYSECHHHECYLRNCGEGEHSLDICLCTGHHRCIECGECAYVCNDVQHFGSITDE